MLRLHKLAQEEIRAAAAWYEERNSGLGKRFVAAVRDVLEALEANPRQFASLETISAELPIRRGLIAEFPYLVIFEVFENDVFVYAVAHAARRPNYWRRRKRGDTTK
jgi:toxin ParE1/3/4